MSISMTIKHAVVKPFYNSDEVLKEFNGEKGTMFAFEVQTRVNDKVSNSPMHFMKCKVFANSANDAVYIRNTVTDGAVLTVEGYLGKNSYKSKTTNKTVYLDELNVKKITPITENNESNNNEPMSDEELPF